MPFTFDTGRDISLAFATPVFSKVFANHESVDAGLRELVLAREQASDGVGRSNVGGWHSEDDFLKWDSPHVATLVDWFSRSVKSVNDMSIGEDHVSGEMDALAWANVSRSGNYNQPHFHPNSDWSGVYYVSTGRGADDVPDAHGGRIEMLDPRTGIAMLDTPGKPFTGNIQFMPEAGLLLVFPSWLMHYVHPHTGSGERISIALNARMVSLGDRVKTRSEKSIWGRLRGK